MTAAVSTAVSASAPSSTSTTAPVLTPRANPRPAAIALMLTSAASSQLGAAAATRAFPALGPAGVVAVRQWVAAAVLLTAVRPRLRSFTRRDWPPVTALALTFGTMNLTLYAAVQRIGLGLAITLEFLGPLALALAAARRPRDAAAATAAGLAVLALLRPRPTADYLGMALALAAAVCWAAYILLNRTVGTRLPGAQGTAAAAALSALLYLPVGTAVFVAHPPAPTAVAFAVASGLLSSTVPAVLDLFALRTVPTRFYGVFMSVHPVLAALVGWLALGQGLAAADWGAIAVIVAANAVGTVGVVGRGVVGRGADGRVAD